MNVCVRAPLCDRWSWAVENVNFNGSADKEFDGLALLPRDEIIVLIRPLPKAPAGVLQTFFATGESELPLPCSSNEVFAADAVPRRWRHAPSGSFLFTPSLGWDGVRDVPEAFVNRLCLASQAFSPQEVLAAETEEKHRRRAVISSSTEDVYFESSDDDASASSPSLSRAASKAVDREVPWRMIAQDDRSEFVAAVAKEWEDWRKWGAVRPATAEEIKRFSKSHVLPARVAYRWKPIPECRKAKARIVVQGFRDPHLPLLVRDSPVLSRTGFFAILQTAANNGWHICSGDCSSAFLQGGTAPERPAQIFMRAPTDPIAKEGCRFEAEFYAILGSVYGLSNSPRLWFTEVRRRLLTLGWVAHPLDPALFLNWDSSRLTARCGFHVDDCLFTICPKAKKVQSDFKSAFSWGSWDQDDFTYTGKRLQRRADGSIYVSMERFVEETQVRMPAYRGRLEEDLTPSEMTEYRSSVGCLQWLSSSARPDPPRISHCVKEVLLRSKACVNFSGLLSTRSRPHKTESWYVLCPGKTCRSSLSLTLLGQTPLTGRPRPACSFWRRRTTPMSAKLRQAS